MTFEEYEAMLVDANKKGQQERYDECISICKEALEFAGCAEDPFIRIWPTGMIVATYLFKHEHDEPDPGSEAYEDLKKYAKVTLDAFHELTPEQQEHYKSSDRLFQSLRPLVEFTQAGRRLSEFQGPAQQESKKSGCFVATAIYGSYSNENVVVLRRYRDNVLLSRPHGRAFVNLYYWVSPPIAVVLKKVPLLRSFSRKFIIQPIVDHLSSR